MILTNLLVSIKINLYCTDRHFLKSCCNAVQTYCTYHKNVLSMQNIWPGALDSDFYNCRGRALLAWYRTTLHSTDWYTYSMCSLEKKN